MITLRPSSERGHANHGWLESRFSFSFAEYYDLKHMGFRNLRVINDDWIDAGQGFGMHPHRDMEIITVVLEGAIQHKDSLGHEAVVRPGEIQRMTAGSGISHSEFNPSRTEKTHLYQIWIKPLAKGLTPSYAQKPYDMPELGQAILLAGQPGENGLIDIHADARLHRARSSDDKPVSIDLAPGRYGWVQVVSGNGQVNGQPVGPGDGVALSDEPQVKLTGNVNALVFDLG
jgi:redox-sensitive bicupin YhaK (pirin superfamily)